MENSEPGAPPDPSSRSVNRRQAILGIAAAGGVLGVGAILYSALRNVEVSEPSSTPPGPGPASPTATIAATPSVAATDTPRTPVLVLASPRPTQTADPTPTEAADVAQPATPEPATPTAAAIPRAPLTGEPIVADLVDRRPVVIKIGHNPEARPQWGLQAADIVYEHITEAQITRFTAIFQSQLVNRIGPTRSARLIDVDIVREYQGLLAHVGGSPGVLESLRVLGPLDVDGLYYPLGRVYFRTTDARPPENTFVDGQNLLLEARARGLPESVVIEPWQYAPDDAEYSSGLQTITLPADLNWPELFRNFYSYDPSAGHYLRFVNSLPHIDAAIAAQITVDNMIIQRTNIFETEIVEDFLGSLSRSIQLVGRGQATLFSGGRAQEGTWRRDRPGNRTRFLAADGSPMKFKPGNTWIHPLDASMSVEVTYPQ